MPATRRFSQAISEGDGISVIVRVDDAGSARAAEEQGAEALALDAFVAGIADATSLPVLWRGPGAAAEAAAAGAAACVLVLARIPDGEALGQALAEAEEAGVECVVDVRDDEELESALERVDPEIFLLSSRNTDSSENALDSVLSLLPDVPAGKLAIAELGVTTRDDVLALERAGVDAVIVEGPEIAELVGTALPEV